MNRNLALEFVRVTEAAALSAGRWIGLGNIEACDKAAVHSMRLALSSLDIDGTIVIGEGERDKAPMLYIGEKVGNGSGPKLALAVDPLEGTTITALGKNEAISVIAASQEGGLLHAPDIYMNKIAVGPKVPKGKIDIKKSPTQNILEVARALQKKPEDMVVVILERPRHEDLISEVRSIGARIKLILDGDVSGAIATCYEDSGIDLLLGIGGAPEGVISAAALKCLGGDFQGQLLWDDSDEEIVSRLHSMGIDDKSKVYGLLDLAKGDVMFSATGVTSGGFLMGVRYFGGGAITHSLVMRSTTKTIREIKTRHHFDVKPNYGW